jgi:predicted RNA-binding protein (virulence factor B family)
MASTKDLIADYLEKGGTVTEYKDCSPKDAMRRSFKPYKSKDGGIYRKRHIKKPEQAVVFSGYNSGKG